MVKMCQDYDRERCNTHAEYGNILAGKASVYCIEEKMKLNRKENGGGFRGCYYI